LDLCSSLLSEAKPLSLTEGRALSPFASELIQPIVNFVQGLAAPQGPLPFAVKLKALSVLLGLALARGSLQSLLSLVSTLLKLDSAASAAPNRDEAAMLQAAKKRIEGFLQVLASHEPGNVWRVAIRTSYGTAYLPFGAAFLGVTGLP